MRYPRNMDEAVEIINSLLSELKELRLKELNASLEAMRGEEEARLEEQYKLLPTKKVMVLPELLPKELPAPHKDGDAERFYTSLRQNSWMEKTFNWGRGVSTTISREMVQLSEELGEPVKYVPEVYGFDSHGKHHKCTRNVKAFSNVAYHAFITRFQGGTLPPKSMETLRQWAK